MDVENGETSSHALILAHQVSIELHWVHALATCRVLIHHLKACLSNIIIILQKFISHPYIPISNSLLWWLLIVQQRPSEYTKKMNTESSFLNCFVPHIWLFYQNARKSLFLHPQQLLSRNKLSSNASKKSNNISNVLFQ